MIHINTVAELVAARGWSQAELARAVGVTRQAVSLWFASKNKMDTIDLHGKHQIRLAKALGVTVEDLTKPLPLIGSFEGKILERELLWDRCYPSLIQFVVALVRGERCAVARLVQTYGLFRSAAIVGKVVWREFHRYKRLIEPRQREQWERVWNVQKSLRLI